MKLGLLPFPLKEALLPGEEHQVQIRDPALVACLEHATAEHSACCGQMLLGRRGDVAVIAPLIELDRCTRDSEGLMYAHLRCVGRVRLNELSVNQDGGFMVATVSLFTDDDEDVSTDEEEIAEALSAALSGDDVAARGAAERSDKRIAAAEAAARAVAESAEANGVSAAEVPRLSPTL